MTVEIISWSISTKVRDRVGIQSHDPWIQTHICYRLRKRSYWIQPNLFGDLLTQVGEQEHYCFLLFGSPLHGPQRVCIFWLNCSLFLNCWVELNQICAQLKQLCIQEPIFGYPTQRHLIMGSKVSAHSSLYPPQTLFVVGILFLRCPCVRACVCVSFCPSVCPSVTFCYFNILKSHCWIFIKPCKHVHICKTNTWDKKVRARGQFY